jgi:PKD repeat protein
MAMSKGTTMALVFAAIGVAAGVGITFAVMSQLSNQDVYQRMMEDDIYENNLSLEDRLKRTGYLSISTQYRSNPEEGKETTFVSKATGGKPPYQIEWKFSDGFTSNMQNVTRSFSEPGQYSGVVTAKDSAGAVEQASISFEVVPPG